MRELRLPELDLHVAPIRNTLGILHGLPGIGEKPLHLFFALDEILPALIAHAVIVGQALARLEAKQNVMRISILRIGIMHVVGANQRNVQLLAHPKELRVDDPLLRDAVVLKLQEVIPLAKAVLILLRALSGLVIQALLDISGHLARKTCGQRNDALMIFLKHLKIHAGLIIIPFREALAHDLCQIRIALVILREQHQMIIPFLTAGLLLVKAGIRRHVNLTAKDGLDPRLLRRAIKIDHAIHHAVIRNGSAVHAKLLHALYIFLNLICAVQKRIFRVDV